MLSATLIQFPSINHEQFLLPSLTSFSNKHKHLTPQTQTQKQTQSLRSIALLLGRGHLRRLSSSAQVEALAPAAATETTNTRIPISKYVVERLGFSKETSLVVSKKLISHRKRSVAAATDLISSENADIVVSYLQDKNECGLNLSHIKKVVRKCPRILVADVDKTLKPKIKLLRDAGFSTSDLALVLTTNPRLYFFDDLSRAIQALRGIMGSHEDVVKVLVPLSWGTSSNFLILERNVDMLENEYGICKERIRKFLTKTPQVLMQNTEAVREGVAKVEDKWGIRRDSGNFLIAVHILCTLSDENINSKCQVFRNFGWSEFDILTIFKSLPTTFGFSEARIKKALEFFMKELGYEPAYLASRPPLFSYSLENRVKPRHRVLAILKEKGLVKAEYQLYSATRPSDHQFFSRFILKFEHVVPNLHQVFINGSEAMPLGNTSEDKTEDLLLE